MTDRSPMNTPVHCSSALQNYDKIILREEKARNHGGAVRSFLYDAMKSHSYLSVAV